MPTHYSGEIASLLEDYRTKGQREASEHRPPTNSAHMDQNESSLQSQADKWLSDEQQLLNIVVTNANKIVNDIRQKAIALLDKADQLLTDNTLQSTIEADMSADRAQLIAATENRMRLEVDWRAFRKENNIIEEASYPESHIMHFAIIAVLVLLETVINAFFYENAQGLLGGFTVALAVAAVNMAGALVLGICFRYKNLATAEMKVFGWLCLILFIALSLYCNALFSSFRAAFQILVDPNDPIQLRQAFTQAGIEAKRVFILDMRIADLMSFILFGTGIILSGLAFWKGYTFDDRYPGHGKKDRAVKAARLAEMDKQDILRQKVRDFFHQRRAEFQAAIHEPAQLMSRASTCFAEVKHATLLLVTQAQSIQRDFALVLNAYRHTNTSVRATDPPAYFRVIEDLTTKVNSAATDTVTEELTKVQDEIKVTREKLQAPLNEKLQSLQTNAATVLNQTITAFLQDLEAEAKERINRMTHAIHQTI